MHESRLARPTGADPTGTHGAAPALDAARTTA